MSVYTDTIDILNEKGWSSRGPGSPDGNLCLGLALQSISPGTRFYDYIDPRWKPVDQAQKRIIGVIKELFPDAHSNTIPHWNDDPRTTFEDVLLVLKTCDYLYGDES